MDIAGEQLLADRPAQLPAGQGMARTRAMSAPLGIVEGYYGKPWNWQARADVIGTLAPYGYRFYFYAPKADAFLRKRWREPHPAELAEQLKALGAYCRSKKVRFGVGLSPFEIYRAFDAQAQSELKAKLSSLDEIGIESLAILFDDMRGDLPRLAEIQVEIMKFVADHTRAKHLAVCPSYYSDDPVLDRFFGRRPERYLEDFGRALDSGVDVFWTGEEVCTREFGIGHLSRVADVLRRKPLLWDNYPVNDGPRMSPFLHLRAFTGRPAAIGPHLAGHAINPALQPTLSLIPALSLVDSYRLADAYAYGKAFHDAAEKVLGAELAALVRDDLTFFQDLGRERLGDWAPRLRKRYEGIDHPGAHEILAWLDGAWKVEKFED
jgi:hyaluronoglucosaminidase